MVRRLSLEFAPSITHNPMQHACPAAVSCPCIHALAHASKESCRTEQPCHQHTHVHTSCGHEPHPAVGGILQGGDHPDIPVTQRQTATHGTSTASTTNTAHRSCCAHCFTYFVILFYIWRGTTRLHNRGWAGLHINILACRYTTATANTAPAVLVCCLGLYSDLHNPAALLRLLLPSTQEYSLLCDHALTQGARLLSLYQLLCAIGTCIHTVAPHVPQQQTR